MTKVIDDLKPVEALYLLDYAEKEEMDKSTKLAATLAHFVSEDFITAKNGRWKTSFEVTEKGKRVCGDLCDYEQECLKAIEDGYDSNILGAVDNFDFRSMMVERGFLRVKQVPKKFLFFRWTSHRYHTTEKFDLAICELEKLKEVLVAGERTGDLVDYWKSMSYAYPSEKQDDDFLKLAKSLVDSVASV